MITRNKIVQSISNISSIRYHISEWWETCWLNLRKCYSVSEWTSFWFLYVRQYHYRDEISDVFVTIGSCEKYRSELFQSSIDKTGLEKFSVSGLNYILPFIKRNLPLLAIRYLEMNEFDEMYPTTSWLWYTEVLKRQWYKKSILNSSASFFQPLDLLHTSWCSTFKKK